MPSLLDALSSLLPNGQAFAMSAQDLPTDQDPAKPQSKPIPGLVANAFSGVHGYDAPIGLWSPSNLGDVLTGRSGIGAVRAGRALYDKLSRSSFDDVNVGPVETKEAPAKDLVFGGPPSPAPSTDVEPTFARTDRAKTQTARRDDAPGKPLDITPDLAGLYNSTQPPPSGSGIVQQNAGGFFGNIFPGGSLLDVLFKNIGNFRDQNKMTLLALGGGLAGSQSWGQGIGRALTAAGPAQMADIQQNRQNQTALALQQKYGLSAPLALAAATNPATMTAILQKQLGINKEYQPITIHGPFGDVVKVFEPTSGRLVDPPGSGGAAGQGATSAGGMQIPREFLAPGVQAYNHTLVGDDYLKQFGPEIQGAVQAYMRGGVMPTGNPRNQGIATVAKTIAQKYANDIGQPDLADDTNFPARRQMRTDLSKDTPGSIGGQLTFGGTSLGHLGDVAEKAADLNNVNGFGNTTLAHWANTLRGQSTDQAAKVNDAQSAVQHYGQEITKFYTGSPGGEAERMRFLNTMDAAKSPKEIAGAIRAERDLIPDRLRQIGRQIADRLGPEEGQKQMARVDVDAAVAKINRSLARLDPDGPEAKMLGSLPRPQTTAEAMKLPKGTHFVDPNGIERVR
jgi:hypothetical protein